MAGYLLRRMGGFLIVLVGITFLVNLIIYIVPGDPVDTIVGQAADEETRERIRRDLGLDLPVHERYLAYIIGREGEDGTMEGGIIRGDLGRSFITRRNVADEIAERFPKTIILALAAVIFSVLMGISFGVVSALHARRGMDLLVLGVAVLGVSSPVFVTGLLLRLLLAERMGIFPPAGYGGLAFLALPALTLGSRSASYLARQTRSALLETVSEDFITAARARGRSATGALLRHALPVAAVPLLAVITLDLAMYLNGSVITETIFSWPGLGRSALRAIQSRDLPLVQGIVLVMAATYAAMGLIGDLLRAAADPRVRR